MGSSCRSAKPGLKRPPSRKHPWSRRDPTGPPNPATAGLKGREWFRACARLGGKARWEAVKPEQKSEAMRNIAMARWHPGGSLILLD